MVDAPIISPRRRQTDHDNEDHTRERGGPFDNPGVITLAWKGAQVSFKGVAVWGAFILLVILGTVLYASYRQEETMRVGFDQDVREHRDQKAAVNMNTCVLSLDQAARDFLRQHFNDGLLKWYCPWVQ